MIEVWEDIKGYEGLYQISNFGRVKRIGKYKNQYTTWESNKILKPKTHTNGYKNIILSKNNIKTTKYIHRLVAEAFIPNPNNLPEINHKDGNKENNYVGNLEWVTRSENNLHAYKNKLRNVKGCCGEKKKVAKIDYKTNEILEIYNSVEEAAKSVGLKSFCNISACCNYAENKDKYKRPYLSAKGFKWRFANDDMKVGDIIK